MSTIALLNDSLRRTFTGGKVVMTQGVAALGEGELAQVLERVRTFDEFTKDNDPHGEHDFGSFEFAGTTYFFKVDYYAPDMEGGSEDRPTPRRRRACSPSCAPTSTNQQQAKENANAYSPADLSRFHGREKRRS